MIYFKPELLEKGTPDKTPVSNITKISPKHFLKMHPHHNEMGNLKTANTDVFEKRFLKKSSEKEISEKETLEKRFQKREKLTC